MDDNGNPATSVTQDVCKLAAKLFEGLALAVLMSLVFSIPGFLATPAFLAGRWDGVTVLMGLWLLVLFASLRLSRRLDL